MSRVVKGRGHVCCQVFHCLEIVCYRVFWMVEFTRSLGASRTLHFREELQALEPLTFFREFCQQQNPRTLESTLLAQMFCKLPCTGPPLNMWAVLGGGVFGSYAT